MTENELKQYLLSKPESVEDYPFGPEASVFKVHNKMFALSAVRGDGMLSVNLKCDPLQAVQLRDVFSAVLPGYHMNKKHWNTVLVDGSLPDGEIERMIDHSYSLVVKSLKKTERQGLELRHGKDVLYRE
ncbi:MmcQ/YjbR family DNA-binding protein [Gynuella sp.]|uniref:MmcQ/YjbR family DNA-binding protein n=1 Tax=Gynuella sp. TaxID=2969146 RepID=UPI003D0F5669